MSPTDPHTRRSALRLAGTAAIGSLLAGCGGPGAQDDAESDPETADTDWESVDTIELEADADGWIGRAPDGIADETNPGLELHADREYEFVIENGDGEYHNFSLHDREGEVDEQLGDDERLEATSLFESEGEAVELTVTATAEMAGYVCEMHPQSMSGEISVREDGENEQE